MLQGFLAGIKCLLGDTKEVDMMRVMKSLIVVIIQKEQN